MSGRYRHRHVRRSLALLCAGRLSLLLVCALGAARAARAQVDDSGPGQVQVIEKVERGAFFTAEAGPVFVVAPDASTDYGLSFGAAVHFGYDVLPILNVALGVSALAAGGSEEIDGAVVLQDRLYVAPSLRLQVALLTSERDFLWVRGEGGVSLLQASDGITEDDGLTVGPSFGGSIGYEHFAVVRHFSFGAQAGMTAYLEPELVMGIYVMPTLKYSF